MPLYLRRGARQLGVYLAVMKTNARSNQLGAKIDRSSRSHDVGKNWRYFLRRLHTTQPRQRGAMARLKVKPCSTIQCFAVIRQMVPTFVDPFLEYGTESSEVGVTYSILNNQNTFAPKLLFCDSDR